MIELDFKILDAKSLLNDIKSVVTFDETEQYLQEAVEKYILSRLAIFKHNREFIYYIFEEEYIETEWKDMISVHYINTSYKTRRTVMRIHIFQTEEISSDSYLGFFTLRSINDVGIMLSYIYPNWKNIKMDHSSTYFYMTYKKRVHILGNEICMYTYPLFVQDTAVTSCSQASMISMSNYLKYKYGFDKIRILDINNSYTYGRKKMFPTLGLDPVQMLEIFDSNGIPIDYKIYDDGAEMLLKEHIDFCIESAMPVLIGVHVIESQHENEQNSGEHVLQIIGHTLSSANDREYIIYDDSGYYISEKRNMEHGTASFVEAVSWKEIKKLLSKIDNNDSGFIMYPIQEKIYILYDDIAKWHFEPIEASVNNWSGNIHKRMFVIDNILLKKYLSSLLIDEDESELLGIETKDEGDANYDKVVEEEVRRILKKNLPHYLWIIEISRDNGNKYLYLADPTLNATTQKTILLSKIAIPTISSVGLLNDFN